MATAPSFDGTQPCLKVDPEIFFPELPEGTPTSEEKKQYEIEVIAAKAVCAPCPFIEPCLAYALKTPNTYGIWGATDERDRKRIKKQASRQKSLDKQKGTP
jgi:WhiB family redox-sensing transcriptional regulator